MMTLHISKKKYIALIAVFFRENGIFLRMNMILYSTIEHPQNLFCRKNFLHSETDKNLMCNHEIFIYLLNKTFINTVCSATDCGYSVDFISPRIKMKIFHSLSPCFTLQRDVELWMKWVYFKNKSRHESLVFNGMMLRGKQWNLVSDWLHIFRRNYTLENFNLGWRRNFLMAKHSVRSERQ